MVPQTTGHADLISRLQDEVNALASKLFNFLGALQRDASPVSVKGEGLMAPLAAGAPDVEAQTELMAGELMQNLETLEALMQQLPDTDATEAQQVAEAAALLHANEAASKELQRELAAAEARLAQLQTAFAALADVRLARGGGAAGGRGSGGGAGGAPT